jgi:mannosyltransferase OCH1-like enzyme
MKIPKNIHYVWLGKGKKPKSFDLAFSSWKKFASGYNIKEWNEESENEFDLPEYYFTAKKNKKWAFASDVLRIHVLKKYGGIYLDTDQILLKDIPESFLDNDFFTAYYHQVKDYYGFQYVGSVPQHSLILKMVDFYKNYNDKSFIIINKVVSDIINSLESAQLKEIKIYPEEYFYPISKKDIDGNTHAYHLGETSWVPTYKKVLHKIPMFARIKKLLPKRILAKFNNIKY